MHTQFQSQFRSMWYHTRRMTGPFLLGMALLTVVPPGRAVVAEAIDDQQIADAIDWLLLQNEDVPGNSINVDVYDGRVTLDGRVSDILAKERAGRIAESIIGVTALENRISVDPPARRDRTISSDVLQALELDPATDSWEIGVETEDGIVTLTGEVNSLAEMDLAETVAKSVSGVREVRNRIAVDYETARPDEEIGQDIEQRLAYDVRVDGALIDVDVDDGSASLSGTVDSWFERRKATENAHEGGAFKVINRLEVAEAASS